MVVRVLNLSEITNYHLKFKKPSRVCPTYHWDIFFLYLRMARNSSLICASEFFVKIMTTILHNVPFFSVSSFKYIWLTKTFMQRFTFNSIIQFLISLAMCQLTNWPNIGVGPHWFLFEWSSCLVQCFDMAVGMSSHFFKFIFKTPQYHQMKALNERISEWPHLALSVLSVKKYVSALLSHTLIYKITLYPCHMFS